MAGVQWIRLYTSFFDNRKIRMIRRQKDGDSIVLFYLYLLTIAGKCNAGGELFFSENIPYNDQILSMEFDCSVDFVKKAIEYLSAVDMVERNDEHFRILDWEAHQNAEGLERLRETSKQSSRRYREKKKLEEQKKNSDVTVTSRDGPDKNSDKNEENKRFDKKDNSTGPESGSDPVVMLPLSNGKEYPVFQEDIDNWENTYPNVNITQELREMREWCNANPQKRKTERGIRNFIINWLSKEQDRGSAGAGRGKEKPPRSFTPTEF